MARNAGRTRAGVLVDRRPHVHAIRKLAVEATGNGLLAPELAAGIQRVKSAKSIGVRAGSWLSLKQAQMLRKAPHITLKGLRDRAIIAVLLNGATLRTGIRATDGPPVLGADALPASVVDLRSCGYSSFSVWSHRWRSARVCRRPLRNRLVSPAIA